MRYLAIFLVLLLAAPAFAADEATEETVPLMFLDVGPGFFTTLSDSSTSDTTDVSKSGVSTFLGLGINMTDKVSLSGRLNLIQESERSVASSLWGWLSYAVGGVGKPGVYFAIGGGTSFDGNIKFAGRGGYQVGLFGGDMMGFVEAEGRAVNEDEIGTAVFGNLGLRAGWGSR